MASWKKRRLLRRFASRSSSKSPSKEKKRGAIRRLFSEPLEQRMLLAVVTGENPAAGSLDNPVSTDVAATFDEAIQAATATTDNFIVQSEFSGRLGAADAVVSVAGNTVTLNPNADFFAGDTIQVTATAGLQGATANTPRVWQFRTASSGSGVFADSGQNVGELASGFVTFGDVDGDGDVDALESGGGHQLSLNDGTGVFTDSGQRINAGGDREFGDVDGDGDLDVVGTTTVWLNDGNGVFTDTTQALGGGSTMEIGDLDGDGRLGLDDRCRLQRRPGVPE